METVREQVNNYRLTIAYDGTRYYGWEHQPGNDMTIQGKLESVLGRMVGEPVEVIGAGRTDAGVHARAMSASVRLQIGYTEEQIQAYLHRYLPDDISVLEVKRAGDRFHARYNATGKTYRYTWWYGLTSPVFERKYMTILPSVKEDGITLLPPPDAARMQAAAAVLQGEHDFRSFCGNSHYKKSCVRTVDTLNVVPSGNMIRLYAHGDGFLQNMVRILAGTILEAGYGRLSEADVQAILEARDRKKAGPTAPPQGLCLMKVDY